MRLRRHSSKFWQFAAPLLWQTSYLVVITIGFGCASTSQPHSTAQVIVVMDPLARKLAKPCPKEYAQRDYEPLAKYLARRVRQPLRVVYAEDLAKALPPEDSSILALVIGEQSVVKSQAVQAGEEFRPLCRLTNRDGNTTHSGVFVVKATDPATRLADLNGRRILFGPSASDATHAAALAALRAAGVWQRANVASRPDGYEAALEVQSSRRRRAPVAVIDSNLLPLLEGCRGIDRGSLRAIGVTAPVPFITVFATQAVDAGHEQQILSALLAVRRSRSLRKALDSQDGFVRLTEVTALKPAANVSARRPYLQIPIASTGRLP